MSAAGGSVRAMVSDDPVVAAPASIVNNHALVDGNMRLGWLATAVSPLTLTSPRRTRRLPIGSSTLSA